MAPAIEEILYPAMEDYELDIMIGQGPSARSVKVPLQRFTLDRRDDPHRAADLAAARALRHRPPARFLHRRGHPRDRDPLGPHPRRARWIRPPRRRSRGARAARRASRTGCCGACATTRRCAPTARSPPTVAAQGARRCSKWTSTASTRSTAGCCARSSTSSAAARSASASLAAALSEERDALEDIHEPFLIQAGFLERTPRGRVATARAYEYFGLTAPQRDRLW